MRRLLALVASAAALLVSGMAFPCGGSFGANVAVDPEQDIIVAWKDGVETYAFQPIFCGTASDFGLILPVPAPLAQNPTIIDQQIFTTVATVAAPTKVTQVQQQTLGCAGGSERAGGVNGMTNETTTVIASGQVGFLDWVQLKADTPASFTDWLTTNRYYPSSSSAASVFDYYVQKGWYFLAFRISQGAAPDGGVICKALGPISLSFPTPVPVVPTRMATAGSTMATSSLSRFSWRIFGITRGDVQLGAQGNSSYTLGFSGAIPAADTSALAGMAEAGDRLTRLMVSFSYGSTDPDVSLGTYPPNDFRDEEYVYVYDDSMCSVGRTAYSARSLLLTLIALSLPGLVCWRRWRRS